MKNGASKTIADEADKDALGHGRTGSSGTLARRSAGGKPGRENAEEPPEARDGGWRATTGIRNATIAPGGPPQASGTFAIALGTFAVALGTFAVALGDMPRASTSLVIPRSAPHKASSKRTSSRRRPARATSTGEVVIVHPMSSPVLPIAVERVSSHRRGAAVAINSRAWRL
ncbi:hypothetical protein [Sorangium sp. So ce124]|uniref:hypothetical protein n=1 Tax=Sorangium sp. So ce124 TaxID=3133280 RepID=UPI003F641921